MNRTDFINLLEGKIQVDRRMLGEIGELIDLFPYFQSAHLLLLKGLNDNDDVKLDKQLKISSIHVADREVLYHLLNKCKIGSFVDIAGSGPGHKPVSEPALETVTESVPESVTDSELRNEQHAMQEITDQNQTVIETAGNSEQLIKEIEKDDGKKGSDHVPPEQHSHSILVSTREETIEPDDVMVVLDEDEETGEEKIFFMDPGFSQPAVSELLEIDTDLNGEPEEPANELQGSGHPRSENGERKLSQAELIEKFILENPRIEPIRDPAQLPVTDISKKFDDNSGGFFTETLAKIYVSQGYYSKAIDVYEKLSLKFPEKSRYFATQIELIKENLKK
jgi:hypothetical protein